MSRKTHPDKYMRALIKEMEAKGWTHVMKRGHSKLVSPTGAVISFSCTPGVLHMIKEVQRDIRRVENGTYKAIHRKEGVSV